MTGVGFGLTGIRPIPVILIAQAANGLLLPIVVVYLLLAVNDSGIVGRDQLNGPLANLAIALVFLVSVMLGTTSLLRAGRSSLGLAPPGPSALLLSLAIALALSIPIFVAAGKRRRQG